MGCETILCDLPDSLLTQILSNLKTKDFVKTSVLSTRWRNVWLSVPGLDLITAHFPCENDFAMFMDRFMEFNQGSRLQNLKIWYFHFDQQVMEFINTVVDSGIQHLDFTMNLRYRDAFMRQNIYKNKTLVSLKLHNIELRNPESVVSLPCLKIMRLEKVCYGKDGPLIVEKLISGCLVLEDLELIRPFDVFYQQLLLFLRVRSQTLKRFAISRGDTDIMVEIDAPRLNYMSLSESKSNRIVVKNLSSLLMIEINTRYHFNYEGHLLPEELRERNIFVDFLTGISSVRHMIICQWTLKVLCCYSKLEPIPQFHNLYYLQVKYFSTLLQLLPAFLESCPNLKILSLDFCYTKEPRQVDFTNVPQCLISTLEYVEIKKLMTNDETGIIKLVNYFLEKSAVLKKMTLSFKQYLSITKQEAENYKKLLTSIKLSPTCQVIIDGHAADDGYVT